MTDDITLPTKPSGEFVSYCDSYSDGAWRGFDADDMESFARAAVLLDRQQRALRGLAEADRALGLDYADKPAPSAEPAEVYNPWRESLQNCINGDNYLKASEYQSLIEELDDLYRLRAASHPEPSAEPVLDKIEQYRMQMAGICTAALGYWKEGEAIHPDYDTPALREVARLYAKYRELHDATRPDHTALLRQALEALEKRYIGALRDNAIDALRAALEGKR